MYLPDQYTYSFRKYDTPKQCVAYKEKACLTLMAFFEWNKELPNNIPYWQYVDMPKHYVWLKTAQKWKKHERKHDVIGRIYHYTPN
jgi:hypothetical protein